MMEPDQIIERIGSDDNPPTLEELQAVQTQLSEAEETVKASIRASRENSATLAELRALKTDLDNIREALATVTPAVETAEAERDAILAEVSETETPVEDDPNATDPEADPDEADPEAKVEPVAASIRTKETLARVRQTPRQVERVSEPDRLQEVNTHYTLRGKELESVETKDLGKAFADTFRTWGGSKTSVLSMKTELAPERTLSGDASANERKLLDLFGANPVVPVTAAGGCCSIPEPIYDQPLIGSLARPIRDAFDVVGASRGAVQAYPPVCIPDSGADIWTCAQDEAVDPDDDTTWKSCVAIECEDSEPTLVEPIYKCLTIGTFQSKFAPEQWEAILFQTDKLAARLAEARLFDWLVASATSNYLNAFETGSTYANFIKQQIRIAAAIRQDERLGDAQLVTVGSNLIYSAIAEDTLQRRLNDADEVEFLKDRVDRVLREFGITYVGSDDVADMSAFTYDGTIPAYPDEIPMVTLPAGSAKVLDGGEKNLGIDVPDFALARQNNVGAFSEFWEGLLVRNCAVVFSTVEVEECGLVCPS